VSAKKKKSLIKNFLFLIYLYYVIDLIRTRQVL